MIIDPAIDSASIVILGQFNPKIVTPQWLALNELISLDELETFDIEIVHGEISRFTGESIKFDVRPQRFSVQTINPPAIAIKDLTIKIFGQLLVHTPITSMGVNRLVHFPVRSHSALMEFGEKLAPKDVWGMWGEKLKSSKGFDVSSSGSKREVLKMLCGRSGGLSSIVMEQSVRDDDCDGKIRVKVERSSEVDIGVFVDVNDHFDLEPEEQPLNEMISILSEKWDECRARSDLIIDHLMNLAGG